MLGWLANHRGSAMRAVPLALSAWTLLGLTAFLPARVAVAEPWIPLHDVDFGSPPNVVGQAPELDAGPFPRNGVTRILDGVPRVAERFAGLEDQPLVFDFEPGEIDVLYEQIELTNPASILFGEDAALYRVEFDVVVAFAENPAASFDVFLDGPIHRLTWSNGLLSTFTGASADPLRAIGTYEDGERSSVRMEFDSMADTWSVFVDDELRFRRGTIARPITDVRFSFYTPPDDEGNPRAAIDDLRISTIPSIQPAVDIRPWSDDNWISASHPEPIPVAVFGSESFDVREVQAESLAFGPGRAAPIRDVELRDLNGDGHLDLVSVYRTEPSGIVPGDREACLTGEIVQQLPPPLPPFDFPRAFGGCDAVRTIPACGLGFEASLLLPPLAWLRRRRRRARR